MSWLVDSGGQWPKRFPISIWNSGASTSKDVQVVVPAAFGAFWEVIDSSGYELRVTDADGITALVYQRSAFTYATRSLTLQLQGVSVAGTDAKQVWLYWGQDGAADGAGSFTASSPLTGQITNLAQRPPVVSFQGESVNATEPSQRISKTDDETQDVWWDVSSALQQAATPSNGFTSGEEIDTVDFGVYSGASPQASMVDEDLTHFVEVQSGAKKWVRTRWKAGTAGTDYTLRLTITTTTDRVVQARIIGSVTDLTE